MPRKRKVGRPKGSKNSPKNPPAPKLPIVWTDKWGKNYTPPELTDEHLTNILCHLRSRMKEQVASDIHCLWTIRRGLLSDYVKDQLEDAIDVIQEICDPNELVDYKHRVLYEEAERRGLNWQD